MKTKANVPQLERSEGSMTESDQQKAEVLNEFFQSVFVEEDTSKLPDFDLRTDNVIEDIEFTVEDVKKKLNQLKEDKAAGPDCIPPKFLKELKNVLALPLYLIFRKSLDESNLPSEWKTANITSIFKKGSKKLPGNYRPISLTSVACKIMESIIRDAAVEHSNKNDSFCSEQHGFTKGRSCLTNLLETLENWTQAIDEGLSVDAIYLDYRKAFDTVPHERLLKKLYSYGLRKKVLYWIGNFLKGRKQQVVVNGAKSEWADVKSGVPQGSVLGPLLFLYYVNDIPETVTSSISMFADDTKLYRVMRNDNDARILQDDLHKLCNWSKDWLLSFNAEKCRHMHLGKTVENQGSYTMTTNGERTQIERSKCEKDVGVWISDDLKPSTQCSKAAAKASSSLGFIKRAFKHIDKDSFVILYNSYVRPQLEYCVQAWSPYYVKDIECLEKIQRRATKLVKHIRKWSYEQRLSYLGLYSLKCRRERGDLIETFKILNDFEGINSGQFFTLSTETRTRGNKFKLYKKHTKRLTRNNFFSQRIINAWNNLPNQVVRAKSVNEFKANIDKYWKKTRYGYQIGSSA